jgi:hypothetical protein
VNNKQIVKKLSIKYGKDVRVIDTITRHPFKFLYYLMQSDDERAFRLKYFGVFVMKKTKLKKGWEILNLDK